MVWILDRTLLGLDRRLWGSWPHAPFIPCRTEYSGKFYVHLYLSSCMQLCQGYTHVNQSESFYILFHFSFPFYFSSQPFLSAFLLYLSFLLFFTTFPFLFPSLPFLSNFLLYLPFLLFFSAFPFFFSQKVFYLS